MVFDGFLAVSKLFWSFQWFSTNRGGGDLKQVIEVDWVGLFLVLLNFFFFLN